MTGDRMSDSQVQAMDATRAGGAAPARRHGAALTYLVTEYPKVSHSFIRREIHALERHGFAVQRLSVRGWDAGLVDPADIEERARTCYILKAGMGRLLAAGARLALLSPARFLSALVLSVRMSRGAQRSLAYHLAYLLEACWAVPRIRRHGARHLHAHFGTNSAQVAMLVHELCGIPYSFTAHGPDEFDMPKSIGLGEKIRRCAFAVAVSAYGRSQMLRWVGQEHWSKVKVVHCGIERSFHDVAPVPVPEAPRLVCVGRLTPQKGQLLLVEAAALLVRAGLEFEIVLAGDGEMRPQVEAAIARHGLGNRIRITGWIDGDQVRREMQAARALVLPSFAEGLPVVIMEAMALRRPVITTYVAGIPELVVPEETGWLVPAGSVADLVQAMKSCLSTPLAAMDDMGGQARARVLQRHDVDREALKLAVLFEESAAIAAAGEAVTAP